MALKTGDFVELEYTGQLKEDGSVFDTTSKDIAVKAGIFNEKSAYGPVIIALGGKHLLQGLDKALEGKETGKSYTMELEPENAFGKKDAKLLKLISTAKFKKQGVNPMPGLRITIDGLMGTVKTVTGGRTIVDFNHPLSGRVVVYDIKVLRTITEVKEKLIALLKLELYEADPKVELSEGVASVKLSEKLPAEITDNFKASALKLITELKDVKFD